MLSYCTQVSSKSRALRSMPVARPTFRGLQSLGLAPETTCSCYTSLCFCSIDSVTRLAGSSLRSCKCPSTGRNIVCRQCKVGLLTNSGHDYSLIILPDIHVLVHLYQYFVGSVCSVSPAYGYLDGNLHLVVTHSQSWERQ
jgi:hypothetical protein